MKWLRWGGIALGLFFLDQMTKTMAIVHFGVVLNQGVSFGLARSLGVFPLILSGVIVVTLGWYWWHQWRHPALLLILVGGLSNLVDRGRYGAVVDWLPIPGTQLRNNLADYVITIGVIWLVCQFFRVIQHRESKLEKENPSL